MKKLLIIALTLALLISLAACKPAEGDASDAPSPDASPNGGISLPGTDAPEDEPTDEPTGEPEPAVVSVSEELPESYDEYIEDEGEYAVKVVFSVNTSVTDFKYVELGFDEGPQSGFSVVSELYTQPELTAEKPLVIQFEFDGDVPNRGISYVDEKGETKTFAVAMSGDDGSIILVEI